MRFFGILAAVKHWRPTMKALMRRFARHQGGASSIEYSLIAVAIAAVVVISVNSLGAKVTENYAAVNTALDQE
jgi:Flp pilus assembly pilin Flp